MTMMASCYFISQGRANLNKMISAFATSSPVQRPLLLKPNDRICLSSRGSRAHFHTTSMSLASELPTKISKTYELTPQKIGNSDLVMTEVSLGTMTWGEQNTEEEAHQQLDIAYERGVVGIDAAELYPVPPKPDTSGLTEKYIGSWIRKRGGTDFREKLVILSKVAGGSQGRRAIEWIRSANRRVDRKNILLAVDGILERLGTDYIDCLQIHWPDRYVPLFGQNEFDPSKMGEAVSFDEQLLTMNDLIKSGKIKTFGLSNETAWGVAQFCFRAEQLNVPKPVSIQNAYSLIDRAFEGQLVETCAEQNANVPLLAYSPLAGGALTGKYLKENVPQGSRFTMFPGYMKRFQSSRAAEAVRKYAGIAAEVGLTPTQLALAWCKDKKFIHSTIIGATSVEQLEENIGAFAVKLEQDTIDAVNGVYQQYRDPSKTS